MKTKAKPCDVFISRLAADAGLGDIVAEALRRNGLEPFADSEVATRDNASDEIWEALTESNALVTILSPGAPSPAMAVEIGAAQAWSKPIYAIASDPSSIRLPVSLSRVRLFAPGAIDDIIRELKRSQEALTKEDRRLLGEIYRDSGTPTDRLALDHRQLAKVTEQFNKRSGKNIADVRLLHEIFRMRKRGELPRIAGKVTSTPRSTSA